MSKYCEKCGCYLPVGEDKCPACGYNPNAKEYYNNLPRVRMWDNASQTLIWKPEDCVNVANKPEVIKAKIESEINYCNPGANCPYGWTCMVPACAKCQYCDVNVSPTLTDGEMRYNYRCRENGRTWSFVDRKDPRYNPEISCPKFHMDNDCCYCDVAHCEMIETSDKDRTSYKNFTKTYTCPYMENENIVKKVIYRCV